MFMAHTLIYLITLRLTSISMILFLHPLSRFANHPHDTFRLQQTPEEVILLFISVKYFQYKFFNFQKLYHYRLEKTINQDTIKMMLLRFFNDKFSMLHILKSDCRDQYAKDNGFGRGSSTSCGVRKNFRDVATDRAH